MRPTSPRVLAVAAVLGVVAGVLLPAVAYGSLPALPWSGPAGIAIGVLLLLATASGLRQRLRGGRGVRPVHPVTVARAAALARASSLVGALVGGLYLGYGGWTASQLGTLVAARADTVVAVAGVVACVGLVVAALRLEAVCRVPDDPSGPAGDDRQPPARA